MLVTQGCYMKLTSPEAINISERTKASSSVNNLVISYAIYGPVRNIELAVDKAMRESLADFQLSSVEYSKKYHDDRININIFVFKQYDSAPSLFRIAWALVSLGTLFILPYHESTDIPYEIHVVRPQAPPGKKTTIIQDHYSISTWNWLPFYFQNTIPAKDDAEYFTSTTGGYIGSIEDGPVGHAAWRRIFDRLIVDLLNEQQTMTVPVAASGS